jgi:hypothetical protein
MAMTMASGRIAFGLAMMVAPRLAGRAFLGAEVERGSVRFLCRIFGIRDLALGVVLLLAAQRGDDVRPALWLGVACDVFDAKAASVAEGGLTRGGRYLVTGAGLSSAAAGAALALRRGPGAGGPAGEG